MAKKIFKISKVYLKYRTFDGYVYFWTLNVICLLWIYYNAYPNRQTECLHKLEHLYPTKYMMEDSIPIHSIPFLTLLLHANLSMWLVQKNRFTQQASQLWYVEYYFLDLLLSMPKNILESEAVIKLAEHLQDQEMNYKIITPYDAQRVLIEDSMKNIEGLHWEEKVSSPSFTNDCLTQCFPGL
jgi:hypothetical protein